MSDIEIIDLTPKTIGDYGVCGYKDAKKHIELQNKIEWFSKYYPDGLRIKVIVSKEGGYQGMIEYMPGKLAHRPVNAENYMFIQCIFVGFKKEYKNKGLATSLLNECITEAKSQEMAGVATVSRKSSFMAGNNIFMKNGFISVDKAKPDFELLVKKFKKQSADPSFKNNTENELSKYKKGLTVLRSVQCPYTEKNVKSIIDTAKNKFNLKTTLVDLKDAESVQNCPSAFGSFCIIYNGKIISYHPISNTRFENIMSKLI